MECVGGEWLFLRDHDSNGPNLNQCYLHGFGFSAFQPLPCTSTTQVFMRSCMSIFTLNMLALHRKKSLSEDVIACPSRLLVTVPMVTTDPPAHWAPAAELDPPWL